MTALVTALDSALLHFIWQGVAVALALWIVLAMLRKRSANARYLAACAALAVLGAMPVATMWRAYARPAPADVAAFTIGQIVTRAEGAQGVDWPGIDWLALAQNWMAPVWACGVLLLSVRMLWGFAKVSRLKREGGPAEAAVLEMVERLASRVRVSMPVRVLMSRLADGPSVVGWMKPVLLLPTATVLGLSAEQLEAVLAHELAHVRRYDYLVNLGQKLMETLFFYHPAVWWVSRRMREEREMCCDDMAVRVCGDAVCYARALAALEKIRVLETSLALGAKDGPLMYRIERLLGVARREPAPARLPGMVAICLVLACLMPSSRMVKAQAPPPPAPAAPKPLPVPTPGPKAQPAPPARAPENSNVVTVEVTVDPEGAVADARVVNGLLGLRRQALEAALAMTFPQDSAATRKLTVPISVPPAESVRRQTPDQFEDLRKAMVEIQRDIAANGVQSSAFIQQLQAQLRELQVQLIEAQRGTAATQGNSKRIEDELRELQLQLSQAAAAEQALRNAPGTQPVR